MHFRRRRLIEDRDTILDLTAKIQELQIEINCMNDSRDFKDAESVRSGQSHVTSKPALLPPFSRSWRNAKPFSGNAEPQQWAAKCLGHAWFFGKRFCKSNGVFLLQHLIRKSQIHGSLMYQNTHHSVIPSEGDFFKELWADQQRLQMSDLHFDKFPNPSTLA